MMYIFMCMEIILRAYGSIEAITNKKIAWIFLTLTFLSDLYTDFIKTNFYFVIY